MEKEGAGRGRLGPGPHRSQHPLCAIPTATPTQGPGLIPPSHRPARSQGTLVLRSPRLSPATYWPTDLQTCRQTGDRGDGVLGGRSSTRDTSALIVEPFFPRSLCTSHSLPSPAARSPPVLSTKMGMGGGRRYLESRREGDTAPIGPNVDPWRSWPSPIPSPSKQSPRSYRSARSGATFLLPSHACSVIGGWYPDGGD